MSYDGGKAGAGVFQALINLMPRHDLYVEPFLGAGAVLRKKRPAPRCSIGIERDARALAEHWRGDEVPGLALLEGDGLAWLRAQLPSPEVASHPGCHHHSPEVARVDVSQRLRAPGGKGRLSLIRGAAGSGDGAADASGRLPARVGSLPSPGLPASPFPASGSRIAGNIEPGRTLIYCDPPYLMETRSCRRGYYRCEFGSAEEHAELLAVVRALPHLVMISGYWSELYGRELEGWRTASFWTTNRRGRRVQEWVWMNFPEPAELHDYRFLGGDFRERERIKRKTQRWRARLATMPPLERHALLTALEELRAA
jgi:hypothetical protein